MDSSETPSGSFRGRGRSSQFGAQEPIRTIPPDLVSKVGQGGTAVRLYSNYFSMMTPNDTIVHGYHVTFDPIVESPKIRRGLLFSHRDVFDSTYIFDGGADLKALKEIPEPLTLFATTQHTNQNIEITIKYTGPISWGHPEMMRLYNTQMRRNLRHIGMTQIGSDFYNASEKKSIPDYRVEVWPGILTAINEHDGGIMAVVSCCHKIIRKDSALDILKRLWQQDRQNFQNNSRSELSGSIVMSHYNKKTYQIDDVIFQRNPVTYRFDKQGTSISLKDYYKDQYKIDVKDDNQPLLLVKPTDRQRRGGIEQDIVLIPELCVLTGITEAMKNDMSFRRELDRHVRLDPVRRLQEMQKNIAKIMSNDQVKSEMERWGIALDPRPAEITGRVLPPEQIFMADETNGIPYQQQSGSFDSSIRSQRLIAPVALEYWVIVAPMREKGTIEQYLDSLVNVARPLGIKIGPPKFFWLENDRTSTYIENFRKIPSGAKMVHVVVPNNNKDRYSAIKHYFCCEQPCPSQVLTLRVLNKKQLTIATKLVLQMSIKMGAQAWTVHIPAQNTMFVGYNTCKDTSKKGRTVGAFVCSTNARSTSWFSQVSYHKTFEEMSSNFTANFKSGLKAWNRENGRFPERIIIYRDGVSEGQIGFIYKTELKQILDLLGEHEDLKEAGIAFTIVNKRVNARFFLRPGPRDPVKNPTAGTVIDSVVTRKERYDFYLISQSVRFGTVNPTMYNIIKDTTRWKPIHHQLLAYKLCHLYYNWTGTISVPAPCHYAYKLAFLIGNCIHQEPNHALANQLYFL
ncbi:piwi-like protein 1 [Tetranychus urticae]|nr:piwi-like protein 1 [Tetranychus urticae]